MIGEVCAPSVNAANIAAQETGHRISNKCWCQQCQGVGHVWESQPCDLLCPFQWHSHCKQLMSVQFVSTKQGIDKSRTLVPMSASIVALSVDDVCL